MSQVVLHTRPATTHTVWDQQSGYSTVASGLSTMSTTTTTGRYSVYSPIRGTSGGYHRNHYSDRQIVEPAGTYATTRRQSPVL